MRDSEPLLAPAIGLGDHAAPALPSRSAAPATLPCKRLTSDSLIAGMNEIEIEHGASIYRLRITSSGKLILTK